MTLVLSGVGWAPKAPPEVVAAGVGELCGSGAAPPSPGFLTCPRRFARAVTRIEGSSLRLVAIGSRTGGGRMEDCGKACACARRCDAPSASAAHGTNSKTALNDNPR